MFSGSHIDTNLKGYVRPRGKGIIDKIQKDPSFKNLREGRRSGLPTKDYYEAEMDESAYDQVPSHVSSQRSQLPEAPEPPSTVRTRKSKNASAGRSSHSSYAPSGISATRDSMSEVHSVTSSHAAPSTAPSKARSRISETQQNRSVVGSSKSVHSHRGRSTTPKPHSNATMRQDHQELGTKLSIKPRSKVGSCYSSSRHHSEHEKVDYNDADYEGDTFIGVEPDDSVSNVGGSRSKKGYDQSLTGSKQVTDGFPMYIPTKQGVYRGNAMQAPYDTVIVAPGSGYKGYGGG